jgi:hypothetical protein
VQQSSCRAISIVVLAFVLTSALARGQETAPTSPAPANEAIESNKHRIELSLGYGITMTLANRQRYDERRHFLVVSPRLSLWAQSFDVDPPFKGTVEVLAALDFFQQFEPNQRYVVGVGPLLRYNFWTGTRVVPFLDFGIGVAPNDLGHPEQGGHFAFEIQGGFGAQVFVRETVALLFEYRLHHLSNAFLYNPNNGVNSSLFTFGAAVFF